MKTTLTIISLALALVSCQQETVQKSTSTTPTNTTPNEMTAMMSTFDVTGQTLLYQGTFENAVHPTSGTVRVYEDKDKNRTLVFENFKTDSGPDLRIYLAEDKSVTNFIQVTNIVKNGNSFVTIPMNANLQKQNHVLIWCKQFSVLFGSAKLK
ncbi:MAG: DM13 domain-containing protein [Bacteroidetes bacterium]|nr:DM13 domain-containing protein [Bacteroidota bacterium]